MVKFVKAGFILVVLMFSAVFPTVAFAQEAQADNALPLPIPAIPDELLQQATQPEELSLTMSAVIILAVLSLAPAIIMMVTSFVRIAIVISFTRTALATQQMPPNQVLMGLSLFLTFFIMSPTLKAVYDEAIVPYQNNEIGAEELYSAGIEPLRDFMFKQMQGDHDIAVLADMLVLSGEERPMVQEDVPTYVLIPAFMICELTKAFKIGILIFIPFIIIDMVVSAVLMSMGMIMLPPVLVSLPFKIILFVLADGWNLIISNLLKGFVT